jgi:flagellar basal-body rod protein FlgG
MTNVSTPGYKSDQLVSSTFKDEMLYRTGNRNKSNPQEIGGISMMRASRETVTGYSQGPIEETGGNLDFALTKPGFFTIEDADGNPIYTRNGSFEIDDDGYLCLSSLGRVLDDDGNPIEMTTDHIRVDRDGNIYEVPLKGLGEDEDVDEDEEDKLIGKIGVVDFADYTQLVKGDNGTFTSQAEPEAADGGIQWKAIERSNLDAVDAMVNMMSSQRASQSAAQVLKMYDQLMSKIVSEIGRV